MVSIVEAKVNGKPQLFAAGSGGRLSPTQRQALMKMGVPEENIFYGKNSIYGFDKLENHAERIILRNLTEGTEVSRWGISWGELQRNASCPSCQPHVEQAGGIFDWKISMFDIEMHKKYIESILAAGKRENLARFGVWCCIGLAHDDSIFEFLAMHMGSASTQIKQRVRDYLDQVWNGNENANPLNDLEQVDWDPDAVEMNDDAAVQGATDLLAGLSLLIKWCAEHNVARLVECAEVLINRIDYLESFELIGGCVANPVDGEMNSQKIFARDLVVGGVSDQDKMKYHEWLFSL
nr:hypothetical protein [Burkholderia anthina]